MNGKNEQFQFVIHGTEKNKKDIIYHNVIENMKLSKEEQVKYLKSRVDILELEMKNRMIFMILVFVGIFGNMAGIIALIGNLYILGISLIILTFICIFVKLYFLFRNLVKQTSNTEFDQIEELKKLVNMKLK